MYGHQPQPHRPNRPPRHGVPHWFHRSDHTHRVAAAILKHGPIARTTLAQDLGLSQGALSRITSDLIYDGVVEESSTEPDGAAEPRERRGRPQTALRIRQSARTFVGVKINAYLATAVAIDARSTIVSRPHSQAITEQTPDVWLIPSPNWWPHARLI